MSNGGAASLPGKRGAHPAPRRSRWSAAALALLVVQAAACGADTSDAATVAPDDASTAADTPALDVTPDAATLPDGGGPGPDTPEEPRADAADLDAPPPDDATLDAAGPEDAKPLDSAEPPDEGPASDVADAGPDAPLPVPTTPVLSEIGCGDGFFEVLGQGGDAPLALDGVLLTGDLADSVGYTFPPGTWLGPGQHLAVEVPDLGLCTLGTLRLTSGATELDAVTPPFLAKAFTWSRFGDAWAPGDPTPDAPNVPASDPAAPLYNPLDIAAFDLELPPESAAALWEDPYTYVDATLTVTLGGVVHGPLAVGARLKGRWGSFQTLDGKPGFKLKINHSVKKQRLLGQKKLTLNNMVQDGAMIREVLSYTLLRAVGVPAPRTGWALLRVNGELQGLYLDLEQFDDVSLDRAFASTAHLYEGEYGEDLHVPYDLEVDEGDAVAIDDLVALADAAAIEGEGWYAATEPLLDWDRAVRLFVAERVLGHWDGYYTSNNYYFHFDDEGRGTLLPWGTDQTFESRLDWFGGGGLLFGRCVSHPDCAARYRQGVIDVAGVLTTLDLDGLAAAVAAFREPYVAADPKKPYDTLGVAPAVEATRAWYAAKRQETLALAACLADPAADFDGDGSDCSVDCDDANAELHPGAQELCADGVDQDCSGWPDDAIDCDDTVSVWLGNHEYRVAAAPYNWFDARAHCQALGSDLAILRGPKEWSFLVQAIPGLGQHGAWLGLTDSAVEGTFVWIDGAPGPAVSADGGDGQNCAWLTPEGVALDDDCWTRRLVVCEAPCPAGSPEAADGDGDTFAACDGDCDDGNAGVGPLADDVCFDDVDQDCSGLPDDGPTCPPPCKAVTVGHRTYRLCDQPRMWPDAVATCTAWGSSVAVADDADESIRLAGALGGASPWLGLTDEANEGLWVTQAGLPAQVAFWSPGQPDDWPDAGGEDCAQLWGDGSWNDLPCTFEQPVICEAACAPTPDGDGDGRAACGSDCDDADPATYVGAPEICGDGKDQGCNGVADDLAECAVGCVPLLTGGSPSLALCPAQQNWTEAQATCAGLGGGLYTPLDADAQTATVSAVLTAAPGGVDAWLGLRDLQAEGEWRLPDGSLAPFTAWAPGEPNDNGGQDCAILQPDGTWNDRACDLPYAALCQLP